MIRTTMGALMLCVTFAACTDPVVIVEDDIPAPPVAVDATYYAGVVTVTWELAAGWNDEAFRVYGRRVTDSDFFFIAEVTSCIAGACSYQDTNVAEGESYEYYVSAVSPASGNETESAATVVVDVPIATPPPLPDGPFVIAMDNANYVTWGVASRGAADFSHYKVYQDLGTEAFLLGETDSEGFIDLLAQNGDTYQYFVTAVDELGHESDGSVLAEGTPRPDFHGEWVYDRVTHPAQSGFRFVEDEATDPLRGGSDTDTHFWLETDVDGWWLVAGAGTTFHRDPFATTALTCGPASDEFCADVPVAPASNYSAADLPVNAQESYVFRVVGDDGEIHYGVIRVEFVGFDGPDAIMIFDWAYQLQPGNPNLVPGVGG